jgi:hypothetical protein
MPPPRASVGFTLAERLLNVTPTRCELVLWRAARDPRGPGQWRRAQCSRATSCLYEQARRLSLWNQAEFDQLPEYTFGETQ